MFCDAVRISGEDDPMMRSRMFVRPLGWTLVGLLCLATSVRGQETPTGGEESAGEDPVHNELRALRDEALDAFLKKDIERLLACLHPNVVAILQNAEVCRGHD